MGADGCAARRWGDDWRLDVGIFYGRNVLAPKSGRRMQISRVARASVAKACAHLFFQSVLYTVVCVVVRRYEFENARET